MVRSSRFPFAKDVLEDFLRRDAIAVSSTAKRTEDSTDLPWLHPNDFCDCLVPREDRRRMDWPKAFASGVSISPLHHSATILSLI